MKIYDAERKTFFPSKEGAQRQNKTGKRQSLLVVAPANLFEKNKDGITFL